MSQLMKRRSKKAGLPPGSLIHIGERKSETVKITAFNFTEDGFEEKEIPYSTSCAEYKNKPGITWINVDGVHDADVVQKIGAVFDLHPLVLEDILNTDQRPKIEDHDDYLYVVLKMLYNGEHKKEIVAEQVSLILGKNYVISFQEKEVGDVFDPIRERIRAGKGTIRKMGADYLAYSLMDAIIDNYFAVFEKMGDKIEDLETEISAKTSSKTMQEVHRLKRELIFLRKSVWPLREVIGQLERGESPLIHRNTLVYFRDIYDHAVQTMDIIETFRDTLAELVNIYLSGNANRMNEIMKVLTVIGTIFLPLTFIVGIYGMNFGYMPELRWWWGYPAVMTGMGLLVLFMLAFFKKKKWF
ncbi:MAG: magnesium/cobalt transporter CorA [Deltaproteobacteria bacterium]|nr:magnesium/cobalt transporter CorA [Deltaproteobacteria bacterium]